MIEDEHSLGILSPSHWTDIFRVIENVARRLAEEPSLKRGELLKYVLALNDALAEAQGKALRLVDTEGR